MAALSQLRQLGAPPACRGRFGFVAPRRLDLVHRRREISHVELYHPVGRATQQGRTGLEVERGGTVGHPCSLINPQVCQTTCCPAPFFVGSDITVAGIVARLVA